MGNSFQESTAAAGDVGVSGNWVQDLFGFATSSMKTYLDYDIRREQAKIAKQQIAAGYSSGSAMPGAYDYSRFAGDGGLMGGLGGLKGDQVFLLGLGAIAVFAIARSR